MQCKGKDLNILRVTLSQLFLEPKFIIVLLLIMSLALESSSAIVLTYHATRSLFRLFQ